MTTPSPIAPVIRMMDLSGTAGAEICSKIHKAAFAPLDEDGWSAAAIGELMASSGVHLLMAHLVLGEDDVPVGFALYRSIAGEAELITLATLPEYQGRGVARALMHQMIFHLEGDGHLEGGRTEKLFLEVRADNLRAVKLYSDLGFEKIGKRSNYYKTRSGSHIDALCLALFLKTACDHKEI